MDHSVAGRRVLITGAARGVGAALARRLHERGARVALAGLEPEALSRVARECGAAPWAECDVADHAETERVVATLVDALGGLDVVVANAGIAKQFPLLGGDPSVLAQTLRVNVLGVYHTVRAAGPHIGHGGGYALLIASLAAAVQLPLLAPTARQRRPWWHSATPCASNCGTPARGSASATSPSWTPT